ncbi:unnamed protein product [Diplocarpon coronariae]|uniref:Uncharacterized protein n=1 Tax=Diplocarpon coronariae TaxID=2795749 RepID=A0A218Z6J1_9HELO|nr:hypothetical protein JHW43_006123 [Diplocarpon mali]OWP02865.1 hypothetical protein B2J93_3445 [Marssonina coronariae]
MPNPYPAELSSCSRTIQASCQLQQSKPAPASAHLAYRDTQQAASPSAVGPATDARFPQAVGHAPEDQKPSPGSWRRYAPLPWLDGTDNMSTDKIQRAVPTTSQTDGE